MTAVQYTSVERFGRALLRARDLDPIYEMLFQVKLEEPKLHRWLVAYWLFYHAGTASWIVEAPDFYQAAFYAFDNKLPRGTERRHFRGEQRKAIEWLQERYDNPEKLVGLLTHAGNAPILTFQQVRERVMLLPYFGDWIAFKVVDMLERVCNFNIDFTDCQLSFYKSPTEAALMVYDEETQLRGSASLEDRVRTVVDWMIIEFGNEKAPPNFNRPIGVQEVETILCKYKSHRSGHYPVGKDVAEIYHGLHHYGKLADTFRKTLEIWLTK